jgi:hypothetical protein
MGRIGDDKPPLDILSSLSRDLASDFAHARRVMFWEERGLVA